MKNILFVQTGGTIDKDYPKTTNGAGFEIGEPAFKRSIQRLSPSFQYQFFTSCTKDSLEITDEDRQCLFEEIKGQTKVALDEGKPLDGIVVTHGTDTMADTARFLAEQVATKAKDSCPILVTGAMKPERFSESDAEFNLGMAIAAVQIAHHGFVGICMHGLVLSHDEIERDLRTGKFFELGDVGNQTPGESLSLSFATVVSPIPPIPEVSRRGTRDASMLSRVSFESAVSGISFATPVSVATPIPNDDVIHRI